MHTKDIETVTESLTNGNTITYKLINRTAYHLETPDAICKVLEEARLKGYRQRLLLDFGDTETGKSWQEKFDIAGYIGRSTGRIKIPLLIHNTRSSGGGAILDHCIIKITDTRTKQVLYKHKKYHL